MHCEGVIRTLKFKIEEKDLLSGWHRLLFHDRNNVNNNVH